MIVLSSLSPVELRILRLKAVIGAATAKTVFMDCLNRVGGSPPWTNKSLTPVLESLRARHFLTELLACEPEFVHTLTADAIASSESFALVSAVNAMFPPDKKKSYYYDEKAVQISTARWMRLAVYLNDEGEYARLQSMRDQCYNSPDVMVQEFAPVAVGGEWFKSRTPVFQRMLIRAKEERLIATGIATPDYGVLVEHCRHSPELRVPCWQSVVSFYVFNLRLDALSEHIAVVPDGLPPDLPLVSRAIHAFLSGNLAHAVPLFGESLVLYRKVNRKRKIQLPGYMGLLHLCALIAANHAGLHSEIEAALDTKEVSLGHYALRALLEMARNREKAAREAVAYGVTVMARYPTPPPLSSALLAVSAFVIDPTLAKQYAGRFVPVFRRIEESMPLAARALAEVLALIADKPKPYQDFLARTDDKISFRFVGIIAIKAPWERALESIEAMLVPSSAPKLDTVARLKRLIWQVDPVSCAVQPVEQALQARGWSAGRIVSLKRLYQGDSKLDYLDDFDRKVVRTITRIPGGWYNEFILELPGMKALPALVGHPRVFDARNPDVSIELIEGRAEIVLSQENEEFRLALSHDASSVNAFVEIEAPGRWRVVVVDEKAVAAAAVLGGKGIRVPAVARDRLIALSRSATPAVPLRIEAVGLDDGNVESGDPAPVVRLLPLGDGLKVSLVVRPFGAEGPYFLPGLGGKMITAQVAGRSTRVRRDFDAEKQAALSLSQSCPSLGGEGPDWALDDLLSCLEFLDEIKSLAVPPALEWPEGQKFSMQGEASAKRFKASVKGTENWFALGGTIVLDEGLVLDLKDLLNRLDRAEGRFIPLDNGAFIALDRHFKAQLERLKRLGDSLKIPTVAGVAVRDLLEDAGSLKADIRWKEFTQNLDDAEEWHPVLGPSFTADLRDYQHDGFVWMSRLARWGAGALLADDMGLGKTVQAIAILVTKAVEGPCLVVAPTSVCGNWGVELARFAPGLQTHRLAEAGDRAETLDKIGPGDVLIVSYGLLAREEDRLAAITWSVAILDEAQAIKNAETQRAKASQRITAGFRLALTGTPVENELDELWSLFRFINPGLLGSRESFGKRFATPIERDGDANAKAALRSLVRPFLLRRTKTAVLSELPARTEQTLLIETSEEERAFYEALRRRALERLEESAGERTRIHILAEITKLRLACCHPALATPDVQIPAAKLDALLELIEELREGRHRALVFSQFVGHLTKVRAALGEKGIRYQYLDGSTPVREREKRVAAFQAGEGDLFLISLKAGGFGLNLTAADYVIHLDPWWNPAVEDQASDRAHRIGQQRPVTIYRLIVKDTIEEGILSLHGRKRDLADVLLEGADSSGKLSEEDLLNLIRGE